MAGNAAKRQVLDESRSTERSWHFSCRPAERGAAPAAQDMGEFQLLQLKCARHSGAAPRGRQPRAHAWLRGAVRVLPPLYRRRERAHVVLRRVLPPLREEDLLLP